MILLVLFCQNTDVPRLCCDVVLLVVSLCCNIVVGGGCLCLIKMDIFGCGWRCCCHLWLYLFFLLISALSSSNSGNLWRKICLFSLLDLTLYWRVLNTDMLSGMSSKQAGCPQFDILVSAVLPDDKKTGLWNSCVTLQGRGSKGWFCENCWWIKYLFNTKQLKIKIPI